MTRRARSTRWAWLDTLSGGLVVLALVALVVVVLSAAARMRAQGATAGVGSPSATTPGAGVAADADVDYCLDPGLVATQITPPNSPLPEPQLTVGPGGILPVVTAAPASSSTPPSGGLIIQRFDGSGVPLNDDILLRKVDVIAVVTVVRCEPGRWSTPDGKIPPMTDGKFVGSIPGIFRPVILRVETPVRGSAIVGQELMISIPGGTTEDGWTTETKGYFTVRRGMRALVLLERSSLRVANLTGFWNVWEWDVVDDKGIASDGFRPQRQFPLEARLQQVQQAWDRVQR